MGNQKISKQTENSYKSKLNKYIILRWILILSIMIVLPIFLFECYKLKRALDEYNSVPELTDIPATKNMPVTTGGPETWPKDELFVESNRSNYKSGELRLIIPKLKLDEAVMDGTSQAALKHGPGLYEYAQLPGEGDRNVSIAGHRAGYSKYYNLFRNIHTLSDGDFLYLTDDEKIYIYQYKETKIVLPDDNSVIYLQGYSCLTLTSCHPIGKNKKRIVVVAELISIEPLDQKFEYLEHN